MSENVINFPGFDGPKGDDTPQISADDALEHCKGKFDDVIIVGISNSRGQCVSTVGLDEAIYELSRAIHILHNFIDRLE